MHGKLRVCVFNRKPAKDEMFQEALAGIEGAELAGLIADRNELHTTLRKKPVDVVLVHLDDELEFGFNLIEQIAHTAPNVGILGVSRHTDPQTIIRAMRAGCAQFVCLPIEREDLFGALERIRYVRQGAASKSRRICVMGATGGAGVTTIACTLAVELANMTQYPAGLVDLNLEFGDINCAFDCNPRYTITDLCQDGGHIDRTMLKSAMHQLPSGVSILSGPKSIGDARPVTSAGIKEILATMATNFPNIVVDLPRIFHTETASALEGADLVLIVTQLNVAGVRNASSICAFLLDHGASPETVQIVLNRCKAEYGNLTPDDVEKHFSRPVFARIPNDFKRVMTALDLGQPISAEAPSSSARLAIQEMARKIASDGQNESGKDERRGLFGRLLSKK